MRTSEPNTEQLVTDLKRVVNDSEELLRATAGAVGGKAQELREKLSNTLDAAKQTCGRLEDKVIDGAKATDRAIREHPYQSIGIALGLGVLIGVLVARK